MRQRLEADYRSQEQMRAELMEQQRQLHDYLLQHRRRRRRPRHQQQQHDDGVVVVKETGTCSGYVTGMAQCLDDMEEDSACNSDGRASSLVMSTSSDNGLRSFCCITHLSIIILIIISAPASFPLLS